MTLKDFISLKKLRLLNASIHIFFYQNWFMKDCARKKKAKIPESRRFFWRYKRTYDLDKYNLHVNCLNNMFTNTNYV